MWKKSKKTVFLDLVSPNGVGPCEDDAKIRLKYTTFMQDYLQLQKEVDVIRSNLDAGKQRKMMLAAEVQFLRKRYEYLVKTEILNSSHEEKLAHPPNLPKHMTGFNKKAAFKHKLPPIPESKPKKKHYIGKVRTSPTRQQSSTRVANLDHKGIMDIKKISVAQPKEKTHANNVSFDLNQDDINKNNSYRGNEVFMRRRAPIFDLNEISTGDGDLQSNYEALKFEEAQNDLLLSVCRNAGEGPSRVGKRKISWQDPVALRV